METKECTRCGIEKPTTEFYHHKRTKDGLQGWCKTCFSPKFGKYPAANRVRQPAVYFVSAEGLGRIKVGLTDCVSKRVRVIQNGCPVPIKILAVLKFETYKKAKELETWIKDTLSVYRVHGEWFEARQPLLDLIAHIVKEEPPILTDAKIDLLFKA